MTYCTPHCAICGVCVCGDVMVWYVCDILYSALSHLWCALCAIPITRADLNIDKPYSGGSCVHCAQSTPYRGNRSGPSDNPYGPKQQQDKTKKNKKKQLNLV